MTIQKLDLGGTAGYESKEAVICVLDGSNADDLVTPLIIGDYNNAPFADDTFIEAFGCCALEELFSWSEMRRILKDGAHLHVGSCGPIPDFPQRMQEAADNGFVIVDNEPPWVDETEDADQSLPPWERCYLDGGLDFFLNKDGWL